MTDNRTTELLPCPFCGEVPDEMHVAATKCRASEPHAGQYHGEVWHYCGEGVHVSTSVYRESRAESVRAAISEWNRRAVVVDVERFCEVSGL